MEKCKLIHPGKINAKYWYSVGRRNLWKHNNRVLGATVQNKLYLSWNESIAVTLGCIRKSITSWCREVAICLVNCPQNNLLSVACDIQEARPDHHSGPFWPQTVWVIVIQNSIKWLKYKAIYLPRPKELITCFPYQSDDF